MQGKGSGFPEGRMQSPSFSGCALPQELPTDSHLRVYPLTFLKALTRSLHIGILEPRDKFKFLPVGLSALSKTWAEAQKACLSHLRWTRLFSVRTENQGSKFLTNMKRDGLQLKTWNVIYQLWQMPSPVFKFKKISYTIFDEGDLAWWQFIWKFPQGVLFTTKCTLTTVWSDWWKLH